MFHAQASKDRLVAAADQQAAYQSYVPAAFAGMGAAVANAASSIVGGGDVSACNMLKGDWQAGPFMVLSCAPNRLVVGLASSNKSLVCTQPGQSQVSGCCWWSLDCMPCAASFKDLSCRSSAACGGRRWPWLAGASSKDLSCRSSAACGGCY